MIDNRYPFYSPLYLMAKPVGSRCNLRCSYCYYLEKGAVIESATTASMGDEVLERFIKSYIEAQAGPVVQFSWHGGEAMMLSLDFYNRVIELQNFYANGRYVTNSIQTNGTLLTDEWCRFLKRHNWLVGVSIDGPKELHDIFRRDTAGNGSFDRVVAGIRLLQKYGVEWNAMAAVNNLNVRHPEAFYTFFKQLGCKYLQFTPVVERYTESGRLATPDVEGELSAQSVSASEWGCFLCDIFDIWVRNDVGEIFVQLFDATLANWLGEMPGLCSVGKICGHAGVIEQNGDLYSCDHFVFPRYRLGNVLTKSITELMTSTAQNEFASQKTGDLSTRCRQCEFLFACHGECPKNRFVKTCDEGYLENFLCEGYKRFFSHVKPYMDFMANEYRMERSPANVMSFFGQSEK